MPNLEFLADPTGATQRIELTPLPFMLGRGKDAHFAVPSQSVSKNHAEIFEVDGKFHIRDLGSRNGVCVNGKTVVEALLANGDIVHLGHSEFRFFDDAVPDTLPEPASVPETEFAPGNLPPSVLYGKPLLKELLQTSSVRAIFQPIVDLNTNGVVGFEALGRGSFPSLSTRPVELFRLASRCSLAVDLSRAFRRAAILQADTLLADSLMFCNLHPEEFAQLQPENFEQLLPELPANCRLVVEIHEDAVADVAILKRFRDHLKSRGVLLAYDDFGAGQSRLTELADVPPDFIKLDMKLVRDIHTARGRRDVVKAICDAAKQLGVAVIAEGIERQEELDVCRQLGCGLGQGFLLGHPELSRPPSPV